MTMPNFLIIGAAKSGTTSLYYYAKQHPEVYMSPIKEPKFFALQGEDLDFRGPGDQERMQNNWITTFEDYLELFRGVTDENAIGEASNLYLYDPKAAARIRRYVPQVKLIAILRDPAERAYSNFLYMIRRGREPLAAFPAALREEERRILNNWMPSWHYKRSGFYYAQLSRYFDEFSTSQIKVYLLEELTADPGCVLQDLFEFLGVDGTFVSDVSERHNPSGIPRRKALHRFLTKPNAIKTALKAVVPPGMSRRTTLRIRNQNLVRPTLSPEVRTELIATYRDDILKLQDLIGRDLSKWLE